MSIKLKSQKALKELQETLVIQPHIQEVHFTATGDHYLNTYELGKGKERKLYGRLNSQPEIVKEEGGRKIYKNISVHTPEAEIVETLTRDEILALTVAEEKMSAKEKKALDKVIAENEELKAKIAELEKK